MKKNVSIKNICEYIWELELDYNLFKLKIDDVYIWQFVRFQVYSEITKMTEVYESAHDVKNSKLDNFKKIPSYIYSATVKNPFIGGEEETIVIDHQRKIKVDGEYKDIYTQELLSSLFSKEEIPFVLEAPYLGKHWTKESKVENRKHLDAYSIFEKIYKYMYKINLTKKEARNITLLQNKLNNYFCIKIDLFNIINEGIKVFKAQYYFFDKLFKVKNTKKLYILVSYFRGGIISAAKDNNVEVIELQHGVITPYHLGYSFPGLNQKLDYFPDKLYLFGDFWCLGIEYPINKKNIEVIGFPYFRKKVVQLKDIKKENNTIVFISQGTIGKELSGVAVKLAKRLEHFKIYYKLHPGEFNRWRHEYKYLIEANNIKNLHIVEKEKDLHELLALAEYQVGVYSTALFEGLDFNCKTIIYQMSGYEYMEYLVNENIISKVTSIEDLIDLINTKWGFKQNKKEINFF